MTESGTGSGPDCYLPGGGTQMQCGSFICDYRDVRVQLQH